MESSNNLSGYSKLKFTSFLFKIGHLYLRLHLETVTNIRLLLQWKLWCVQCPCKRIVKRKKNKMICLHYIPPDKVIATIVSTFCTNAQRCIPSHAVFVAKQNILWNPIEKDMFTNNNLTRNIASMPLNNFPPIRFLLPKVFWDKTMISFFSVWIFIYW